ncbi:hypothetical protein D3C71_1943640 [compost metagenome]
MPPSSSAAVGDFCTVTCWMISEANMSNSTSRPPLPEAVARSLIETWVYSEGRPRTLTLVPNPLLRSMVTPGTRCRASARFCSGKSATSVATIESEKPTVARLMSTACSRLRL